VIDWAPAATFYHVYPLGLLGAPRRNDLAAAPVPRLAALTGWRDHLRSLGVTALYLGPVFESTAHGYDTIDYHAVDSRLGTADTLREVVDRFHEAGIRVLLDGVLNHVGRDHWAFRDVRERLADSPYAGWFRSLRFGGRSPAGDPFTYEGWAGHFDLVALDLASQEVRAHLFDAVTAWFERFDIDGLRLDAADVIDLDFLRALASHVRAQRPDAWLVGEVVHGDYARWANPEMLDSVTNYEAYKGLWSSLVDVNYFEIAYALERQFGAGGIYRGLPLYNFVDNHDVDRVASLLPRAEQLYPLHCLLFTMPGVPSIYAGSEWGIEGRRRPGDDSALRPALDLATAPLAGRSPELATAIGRLARVRAGSVALRRGDYRQLHVGHEQLAFAREKDGERVVVMLNAARESVAFDLDMRGSVAVDLLDHRERLPIATGRLRAIVPPSWARIMRVE